MQVNARQTHTSGSHHDRPTAQPPIPRARRPAARQIRSVKSPLERENARNASHDPGRPSPDLPGKDPMLSWRLSKKHPGLYRLLPLFCTNASSCRTARSLITFHSHHQRPTHVVSRLICSDMVTIYFCRRTSGGLLGVTSAFRCTPIDRFAVAAGAPCYRAHKAVGTSGCINKCMRSSQNILPCGVQSGCIT
jgi:hypothetical protein